MLIGLDFESDKDRSVKNHGLIDQYFFVRILVSIHSLVNTKRRDRVVC
ncbi:protein of unknown function [Candidatus Nitrosocosmicus franklandus]|uniref:Uncharacterized protein n=1 Tax=Candidatus Nitrosocosmicus franklandianus TaxID=1798806 RepID=A0A484IFU3_9ARCH|nr:protein of unknown function [Candidatus Nitrosocosmicus franklandus]